MVAVPIFAPALTLGDVIRHKGVHFPVSPHMGLCHLRECSLGLPGCSPYSHLSLAGDGESFPCSGGSPELDSPRYLRQTLYFCPCLQVKRGTPVLSMGRASPSLELWGLYESPPTPAFKGPSLASSKREGWMLISQVRSSLNILWLLATSGPVWGLQNN